MWLDISHNKIVKIPGGIVRIKTLTFLNLSHNRVDEIPSKLGEARYVVDAEASTVKDTVSVRYM